MRSSRLSELGAWSKVSCAPNSRTVIREGAQPRGFSSHSRGAYGHEEHAVKADAHDEEHDELRGEGRRDLHSRGEEDAGHGSHLDNTAPSV